MPTELVDLMQPAVAPYQAAAGNLPLQHDCYHAFVYFWRAAGALLSHWR